MRSVLVDSNVPATNGLVEFNHHARDELKEVTNGAAFDGKGLFEEESSKVNGDENDRRTELSLAQDCPPRQHQLPQGPLVQWERFLPVRSLKVLLVENDDSTRHVVSALLRNCSYEVTAVANGIEAWKVLADLTKHIDLVLTEVVMPYLSGIGLLAKIMSNISCKSIPVIMMSSDDSMGVVFNCLSKGAVDFLVKPIRKNELKNLWQHVWRKCHSSSGSGSESGIRTQKYTKSRSIESSENDSGSNDEDGNGSISLTVKDRSDNGSDTQSSWSKRAVEVNSTKAISLWDQVADPPDSTRTQVVHTRQETISNYWTPTTATRECDGEDNKLDTLVMGKDLAIGVSRDPDQLFVGPSKNVRSNLAHMKKTKVSAPNSKKVCDELQKGTLELICEMQSGELRTETTDLVGTITRTSDVQIESSAAEVPKELSKIANVKEKDICYTKELPVLELSLKGLRGVEDAETSAQKRNVLRHSDLSAFSRYNTPTNSKHAPTRNAVSSSLLEKSSEVAKTESTQYLNSNLNENPNQLSNGSSNNDDMGSTTNNAFTKLENLADAKPIPKSIISIHSSSALQSTHLDHASSIQPAIPSIVGGATADSVSTQPKAARQQVQVHHHHYHHHHHHVHNMQQQKQVSKHDDVSSRDMTSNLLTGPVEGNAANYGSASGSNNRSNGENGSSTGQKGSSSAAVAEGAKMGSDSGVSGNFGTGDGTGSGSGSGVDQSRFAQREAALNKFRQKRKDRCFEKKVRYHSRKKLAEQRPRVRGQFVRQGVQDLKNEDANS